MASDNETKQEFCKNLGRHDFKTVVTKDGFQGFQCSVCDAFVSAEEIQMVLDAKKGGQHES